MQSIKDLLSEFNFHTLMTYVPDHWNIMAKFLEYYRFEVEDISLFLKYFCWLDISTLDIMLCGFENIIESGFAAETGYEALSKFILHFVSLDVGGIFYDENDKTVAALENSRHLPRIRIFEMLARLVGLTKWKSMGRYTDQGHLKRIFVTIFGILALNDPACNKLTKELAKKINKSRAQNNRFFDQPFRGYNNSLQLLPQPIMEGIRSEQEGYSIEADLELARAIENIEPDEMEGYIPEAQELDSIIRRMMSDKMDITCEGDLENATEPLGYGERMDVEPSVQRSIINADGGRITIPVMLIGEIRANVNLQFDV